ELSIGISNPEVIQKVWLKIDIEYFNKLIESMPQHVLDVYKARGVTLN
ncbi:33487_t:CDS:1, partial [Gigaspora margarita]